MKKNANYLIPIGAGCVTLIFTPSISFDSFNVSKFVALLGFGTSCIYFTLMNVKNLFQKTSKYFVTISTLFLLFCLLSVFFSKQPFWQSIYGVQGRHTGFLTMLSLLIFLVVSVLSFSIKIEKAIVNVLLITGCTTLFYGMLQSFDLDPVSWASASESPVIGFLGNPNFAGSFLGMIAGVIFAKILDTNINFKVKLGFFFYLIFNLFIIYKTKALQGFLVAAITCFIVTLYYIHTKFKSSVLTFSALLMGVLGAVALLLDIFQKSFWQPLLYGTTIDYRGDYWRAGWRMTLENPIFGVGFDGYRDHYRQFRDLPAVLRPAGENLNDSAHNVFLDISSSGGFPLLFIYLLLVALTVYSALRTLAKTDGYQVNSIAIFAAWVGFSAQSIISINQIGLAIWGWVLSGFVIGNYYHYKNGQNSIIKSKSNTFPIKNRISTPGISFSFLLGVLLALPVFRADYIFKQGIDSKNVEKLVSSSQAWPQQPTRMNLASVLLLQSKFYAQAKDLSKKSVEINPNFFESWKILAVNPDLSLAEQEEALKQMKRLDPYFDQIPDGNGV
jgi:O-antigen ligase